MTSRTLRLLALVATLAALQTPLSPGSAQGQTSDACATAFGICRVPLRPIGSYCECYGDPGRIVPPPQPIAPPAPPPPPNAPITDACGTPYGVCRVLPGPVGSPCNCFGDPGHRILPPPSRF